MNGTKTKHAIIGRGIHSVKSPVYNGIWFNQEQRGTASPTAKLKTHIKTQKIQFPTVTNHALNKYNGIDEKSTLSLGSLFCIAKVSFIKSFLQWSL